MQPPWEIAVWKKDKLLTEFQVPAHKLDRNDLAKFLKALVVRGRTDDFKEMIPFYVNRRRGAPDYLPFAEVQRCNNLERNRVGYWCGNWDCYATAMQKIDDETANWMNTEIMRNRGV